MDASIIKEFLLALISHVWLLYTILGTAALGFIHWLLKRFKVLSHFTLLLYVAFIFLVLLVGSFLAYQEQFQKAKDLGRQLAEKITEIDKAKKDFESLQGEKQKKEKEDRKKIRVALGKFLDEGIQIQVHCGQNPPGNVTYDEYVNWTRRIDKYFATKLDSSYHSRFEKTLGILITYPPGLSPENARVWGIVKVRNTKLDEFIKEFTEQNK